MLRFSEFTSKLFGVPRGETHVESHVDRLPFVGHPSTTLIQEYLVETLRPGMRVLEIGTGEGSVAISAAELGAQVIALDIDAEAVAAAQAQADKKSISQERMQLLVADLDRAFMGDQIIFERQFDVIVCNLPSSPLPEEWIEDPVRDGGVDGRMYLDRLLAPTNRIHRLLRPGGQLIIIQSNVSNVDKTIAALTQPVGIGLGLSIRRIDAHEILAGEHTRTVAKYLAKNATQGLCLGEQCKLREVGGDLFYTLYLLVAQSDPLSIPE
ncbi:methyltransferase domain-containing protein [Candidatus Woesebacteria bacterium]|nr:methyltransferase domain-containing protein [Candidatus Woesebacteria bacterium]